MRPKQQIGTQVDDRRSDPLRRLRPGGFGLARFRPDRRFAGCALWSLALGALCWFAIVLAYRLFAR